MGMRRIGLSLMLALPALAASNAYIQHNLIADTAGVADLTDPNLVNPWAIAESASSPFWISDNGTGLATVYSTSATATISIASLKVTIPPGASSGTIPGPVTGQLSNSTTVFLIGTTKASFLFCTADGTISGWNGGTAATIKVDNSSKAPYTKASPWVGHPLRRSSTWRISIPESKSTMAILRQSRWLRAPSPIP